MSDHIDVDGKRYYEESYLTLANNNAKRLREELESAYLAHAELSALKIRYAQLLVFCEREAGRQRAVLELRSQASRQRAKLAAASRDLLEARDIVNCLSNEALMLEKRADEIEAEAPCESR